MSELEKSGPRELGGGLQGSASTPASQHRIECFEPATRARLGEVEVDSADDVRAAVRRARAAQPSLAAASFDKRRRVLARMRDYLIENTDALVELIVRDSGKTRENALNGEIWPVLEKLRWTIAEGERHLRDERVSAGLFAHKTARIEYRPLGVLGAILPWNYPLQNLMNPIVPAIMTGNAVVLKPSEWVAWSSERVVAFVREALRAEGLPADLVQLVQGYGDTGAALIESGIDGLVFIGSVGNGQRVAEACARQLIPAVLELGGKDPFIVCEDAALDAAAHAALSGTFINCGQNCVSSERILVHTSRYAEFEAKVADAVRAFRQGDGQDGPVDVGAMITPLQLELVESLVARAVAEGARVVTGGARVKREQGDYFAPTILADVTPEMTIMREETFGPVMLLCRFSEDAEAVRIANGTPFGLSASVFSKDLRRARDIASQIDSGMVAINDFGGMTYMAQDLPFGGVKRSGYGRLNGRAGLHALSNVRAVLDERLPLGIPSKVFPVGPADYALFRAGVHLLYASGAKAKLAAGRRLVAALVDARRSK